MADEKPASRGDAYGGHWTKRRLLIRDGAQCFYCGQPFSASMEGWSHMATDHVIPQNKEEQHGIENLRLCCKECNSAKGNKVLSTEQLTLFRLRRRLTWERDEQWARWHLQLMEEIRRGNSSKDLPDPKELAERLITRLNDSDVTSDAARYTRATTSVGIFFHRDLDGEKREWYFYTDTFQLQPVFIGWEDAEAPIDDFDLLGYFNNERRCKYVRPFADAGRGVAIIRREVHAVEEAWRLRQRLK